MSVYGGFLVVEDEPQAADSIARLLQRFRPTEYALTVRAARDKLEEADRHWTGLVADIGLPDGSGLELVQHARGKLPLLPILVLTGRNDRLSINRAHELRAEFVCKPATETDLFGFARRAVAFERVPDERLVWLIEELSRQRGLTGRESDIVAAAVANTPRKQLMDQFGITENTLKSQVRQLLRKTDHDSLDDLTRSLLRGALGGSETGSLRVTLEED